MTSVYRLDPSRQDPPAQLMHPDSQRGGLAQHNASHRLSSLARHQRSQHNAGAAPLHDDRRERDIQRACSEQPIHHGLIGLGIEIVQVRLHLNDGLCVANGRRK